MKTLPGRRFITVLSAITVTGAALRFAWIGSQTPTQDDAQVAWTAWLYTLHGQTWPTMAHHPVLRNLMVFVSTRLFGGSVLGVKGLSLLFGTLLVVVTGLLVRRAARDDRAGLIAAGIVALDGVQIVYSRQAINDVHAALFAVLGAWLTVEALRAENTRCWRWLVPLAGLAFGLGAAEKFYALPLLATAAVLLGYSAWKRQSAGEGLLVAAALGPLPFLVYLLTYIPWFRRGYDLPEWIRYQASLINAMATFTRPSVGFRANNRAAWWFLRPFYGHDEVAITASHQVQLSVGVGNPVVWLAVLPAVGYSLLTPEQRRRDALLLTFFFASYLPLVLSSRPIWVLSSVAVTPFAAGLLGSVVSAFSRRYGPKVLLVYGSAVLVTSLMLYPLSIGRALEFGYLRPIVVQVGDYMNVTNGGPPQ
jgi:dolichyl-phosphate-mannose--protein O-mannosyl transferase